MTARSLSRSARILLGLMLLGGVVGVFWWYNREGRPTPPEPDLAGVDTEVAEKIRSARKEVLAAPRSAERWGHLGMVLRVHDFGEEANLCFRQAERLDPAEPRWPYFRGLTLALTDPRGGLDCLRRAAERIADEDSPARFRLVEVLLEQGEFDEADEQLRRASAGGEHPRGVLLRARLAMARQEWKDALALAEACFGNPSARRQAHLIAADAARRAGETARADELLERAGKLPPDQGWPDPFVAEVERLRVGRTARLARAESLMAEGRTTEAVEVLGELMRDMPGDVTARVMLGQTLLRANRLEPAEQVLMQAVGLSPESVDGWFYLGAVRVLRGMKREAVTAFRETVRLKPDHALAYHNLAVCLRELGEKEEARKAWEEALRSQPDHAAARQGLAELEKERREMLNSKKP